MLQRHPREGEVVALADDHQLALHALVVDEAGLGRVALTRKAGEALRALLLGRALQQLDVIEPGLRVVRVGREVGREGNFAAGDVLVPRDLVSNQLIPGVGGVDHFEAMRSESEITVRCSSGIIQQ